MRARVLVLFVLLATTALSGQTPSPPPQTQQPVFRTGVEILTVDATVVDREGRQITDLQATEFAVEVDGDRGRSSPPSTSSWSTTRRSRSARRKPGPPSPTRTTRSFDQRARADRRADSIVLLVDQGNIRVGQGRQMMRSAVKFVDGLVADRSRRDGRDPAAAPLVDFTTKHETGARSAAGDGRPRHAVQGPLPHQPQRGDRDRASTATRRCAQQLILRECGGALMSPVDVARCEIEVEQEAGEIVNHQRHADAGLAARRCARC